MFEGVRAVSNARNPSRHSLVNPSCAAGITPTIADRQQGLPLVIGSIRTATCHRLDLSLMGAQGYAGQISSSWVFSHTHRWEIVRRRIIRFACCVFWSTLILKELGLVLGQGDWRVTQTMTMVFSSFSAGCEDEPTTWCSPNVRFWAMWMAPEQEYEGVSVKCPHTVRGLRRCVAMAVNTLKFRPKSWSHDWHDIR